MAEADELEANVDGKSEAYNAFDDSDDPTQTSAVGDDDNGAAAVRPAAAAAGRPQRVTAENGAEPTMSAWEVRECAKGGGSVASQVANCSVCGRLCLCFVVHSSQPIFDRISPLVYNDHRQLQLRAKKMAEEVARRRSLAARAAETAAFGGDDTSGGWPDLDDTDGDFDGTHGNGGASYEFNGGDETTTTMRRMGDGATWQQQGARNAMAAAHGKASARPPTRVQQRMPTAANAGVANHNAGM